jgi:hypothetical protein
MFGQDAVAAEQLSRRSSCGWHGCGLGEVVMLSDGGDNCALPEMPD